MFYSAHYLTVSLQPDTAGSILRPWLRAKLPAAAPPSNGSSRPGKELQQVDFFLKGTVLKRMMKCGQPRCPCQADPAKRHGPYFEWTYKVAGKTVNVKLSPEAAQLYQAAIKQHRRLKAILTRMERLSRSALAQMAKQAAR
jgi:uncharacterized protein DUF6788